MINPLNELSSVYLDHIAEQEQTPEALKQRVAQMVKAIRYRARKEAVPVSKAFNDYIGSVNATSVERQSVKERLGLTGGVSHKEEYVAEKNEVEVPTGNIAKLAKKASARIDSDVSGSIDSKDSTDKTMGVFIPSPDGKKKIYGTRVKESFSNWRQDLSEVMDDSEVRKEIKEKKVKNKVIINPVMKEAIEELGGELLEMVEVSEERNDEPGEGTKQKYGDMRGLDRSGAPTSFGGKWQSKERKAAGAAALAKLKKEETEIEEGIGMTMAKAIGNPPTVSKRMRLKQALVNREIAKNAEKNKEKSYSGKAAVASEEVDLEEGMTLKDFKANRRKLKRKEASDDAKKRGHVGKEWYNSGRTYSPDEAKSGRSNMPDHERQTRHRSAVDPDNDNDDMYSADKTKNPKKLRKQKAMGELGEGTLQEKALSKAQQRFMGMVYAVKQGKMKAPSAEVAKAASSMTGKEAKDFAKTKHKGLPEKKVEEQMDSQMEPSASDDKQVEQQRKKIQMQKIRDLNIRLQAARKGVY